MKHTPTPWILDGADDFYLIQEDRTAKAIGEVGSYEGCPVSDSEVGANAAFIVRAVNAHEELVKALKIAQAVVCHYLDHVPDEYAIGGNQKFLVQGAINRIDQVIAKAEGGTECPIQYLA